MFPNYCVLRSPLGPQHLLPNISHLPLLWHNELSSNNCWTARSLKIGRNLKFLQVSANSSFKVIQQMGRVFLSAAQGQWLRTNLGIFNLAKNLKRHLQLKLDSGLRLKVLSFKQSHVDKAYGSYWSVPLTEWEPIMSCCIYYFSPSI